ncbi:MAG TPA: PLP-dependent transferase, partial [Propionibacteriaceae bacterium]|nr:PLP-dependent transferase [Propionibacteriaceae bacterium]
MNRPAESSAPYTRPETVAVTVGRPPHAAGAPFNPPVQFASTYVGGADLDATIGYGRDGNPTWTALEEAVGTLEGGAALTFASGMAASQAVLELVEPGATVVLPRTCYLGVAAAVDARASRYGWSVRRVDVADTEAVLAAADGADLVWLESPTNPLIEVADLPRIGQELTGRVRLVVDNTFATPLLQRPLEHGASLVVHSMTKLLSGHSDVLLGAVVVPPADTATLADLAGIRQAFGAVPGPMEAYLSLRGLRT